MSTYSLTIQFKDLAELQSFAGGEVQLPAVTQEVTAPVVVAPKKQKVATVATVPPIETQVAPPLASAEMPAGTLTHDMVVRLATEKCAGSPENVLGVKNICKSFGIAKLLQATPDQLPRIYEAMKAL